MENMNDGLTDGLMDWAAGFARDFEDFNGIVSKITAFVRDNDYTRDEIVRMGWRKLLDRAEGW